MAPAGETKKKSKSVSGSRGLCLEEATRRRGEGADEGQFECEDGRGLKPLLAHGPGVQAEERRSRGEGPPGRGDESGELVTSCCARSGNDGALLPNRTAGKCFNTA